MTISFKEELSREGLDPGGRMGTRTASYHMQKSAVLRLASLGQSKKFFAIRSVSEYIVFHSKLNPLDYFIKLKTLRNKLTSFQIDVTLTSFFQS